MVANDNGKPSLSVVEVAVKRSFANILRVMRGTGEPNRILNDIEFIAEETARSQGDIGKRQEARNKFLDGLLSWHNDQPGVRPYIEQAMCEASLRLIAARLDNSKTQESGARSDLWNALNTAWEEREAERDQRVAGEIEEKVAAIMGRHETTRLSDEDNDNAISAAQPSECYVYFVTDGDAIKIGKANNPKSRLSGLQTSHHKHLSILALTPGNERLEGELHRLFQTKRLRGEWFEDCPEIRSLINDINSGVYSAPEREAA